MNFDDLQIGDLVKIKCKCSTCIKDNNKKFMIVEKNQKNNKTINLVLYADFKFRDFSTTISSNLKKLSKEK